MTNFNKDVGEKLHEIALLLGKRVVIGRVAECLDYYPASQSGYRRSRGNDSSKALMLARRF